MDLLEGNELVNSQTAIDIDPSESFNSEFQFSDELFDEYSNEEHHIERARRKRGLFSLIVSATAGIASVVRAGKKAHALIKNSKRAKRAIERGKNLYKEGKEIYDQGKAMYARGKKRLDKGKARYLAIKGKMASDFEFINGTFQEMKGQERNVDESGQPIVGEEGEKDQLASDVKTTLGIVQKNNELLQENSIAIDRNYDAIEANGQNIDRNYEEILENGLKIEQNFEAIQENAKLIDRNYDAIQSVEYTINKNFEVELKKFEDIQKTMSEALDTLQEVKGDIVDRIAQAEKTINEHTDDVVRRHTYSGLKDCFDYFIDESNRIRALKIDQRIVQLEKPNGILPTLEDHKKPGPTSMYTLLSKIIQDNYAKPRDKNDEMAFAMLEELCYGMQVYTMIIYFLMEQYGILSESYYFKSDVEKHNRYYQLSYDSFTDFEVTLVGNGKFLDKVTNVINQVKSIDFVQSDRPEIFAFCVESLKNLQGIRDALAKLNQAFDPDTPGKMDPKLNFKSSDVKIPNKMNQQWVPNGKLSYAVQFVGGGSLISSFISGWSDEYELDDVGHPVVTIPSDPLGRSRAIFRKIGKDPSQLVAVIKDSSVTSFKDINRELFDAARQKNHDRALERVAFYIEHGADVNALLEHDRRPIHAAADNGVWDIAKLLIQNGSTIDVQDDNGYSPIYIVTESGQQEFVSKLVELGANVSLPISKEHLQLTPLHSAAYKGHVEIVQTLLSSSSVEVNARTTKGQTPLHYAASFCNEDIVELLLKNDRTDVNAQTDQQMTPLHFSSINNCDKVVAKLSEAKVLNVSATAEQGVTALHLAATYGSADVVQQLINLGADPNAKTDQGASVFHHAAFGGNAEIVSIVAGKMLGKGNRNVPNDLDRPPLYVACQFGHLEAAEKLIEICANINLPLSKSRTMLHLAAINGDHMAAVNLIKLQISLSTTDDYGRTALHYAIAYNYLTIAYALLKAGASPNTRDKDNVPLIHMTSFLDENAALNMIKLLADYETNFELTDDNNRETILNVFCKMNYIKVVQFLVASTKVNINARQVHGLTPLISASELGHSEIVQLLVDSNKADLDAHQMNDHTALMFAAKNGHLRVAEILVGKGADVNIKGFRYQTALHYAADKGHFEIVKLLVRKGAELNAKEKDGMTPLHYAAQNNYFEIVKLLVEKGADVNAKSDEYDMQPFHYATNGQGSAEIVDYLLKHGANNDLKSEDERNCVHNALRNKNFDLARYLIDNGGDYKRASNKGLSAFNSACKNGADVEFVRYLASKDGVNVYEFSVNGETSWGALKFAIAGDGDVLLVRCLIEEFGLSFRGSSYTGHNGHTDKTLIELAIDKNKADVVKYLLNKGADHRTGAPLRGAAVKGHNEIVKHLLDNDPKQREYDENDYWLIIWIAIQGQGDAKTVKYLVEAGSKTSFSDKYNYNLVHLCTFMGKLDVLKYLVEEVGLNSNLRIETLVPSRVSGTSWEGWSERLPLHTAASKNYTDIVQYLVNRTVDNVDATDEAGRTPLDYALFDAKNWDMAKFLLSKGADINLIKTDRFEECISNSIKEGKYDMAKYLLANSNHGPSMTKSPLHFAVEMDDIEFVYYLLGKGADYNKKDGDGKTPIDLMIDEKKYDAIKFFLFYYKDQDGTTVLHHKAREGDFDRVRFLVERGADVNAQNADGDTPLHFARDDHWDVVKLLVEHNCAAISIQNSKGQTGLDVVEHSKGRSRRRRSVDTEFNSEKPVKSSAVRPSWWIADAIGGLLSGFKTLAEDVSQFLTKSNLAQSPPNMPKSNSLVLDQNFDVNGTILLLDMLVRCKTGQKYLPFGAQSSITPVKARTYALNLIDKFESLLIESSNDQLVVKQFDSFKLFQTIESYAISEQFDKIEQTLNSFVLETFDRIDSKLLARQIDRLLIETQLEGSQSQICDFQSCNPTKFNTARNPNYIGFEKHELI